MIHFLKEFASLAKFTSFEGDDLVVIYYLKTSEIWPEKRGDLWWEWSYKRRSIVFHK
jgi:hypothetical protein